MVVISCLPQVMDSERKLKTMSILQEASSKEYYIATTNIERHYRADVQLTAEVEGPWNIYIYIV